MSDLLRELGDAKELVELVYPDLIQPIAKQLGSNAATVVEFLSLPLLRMKYAVVERKLRFKRRVERLLLRLDEVPAGSRTEIPSSVGVPVFDQLAVESDEDISELFLQLLKTSASADTVHLAHPSFVTCIKNISGDEARLLRHLSTKATVPFVSLRLQFNQTEGLEKSPILTGLERIVSPIVAENVPLYFDNLAGLRLLAVGAGSLSDIGRWYKPLFELYEPLRRQIYETGHTDGKRYEVVFVTGYYNITSYGRLFMKACLKEDEAQ